MQDSQLMQLYIDISQNHNTTVKICNKERLDSEQLGNSEAFPLNNMPVYLINSEQFFDDQKIPYYQVRLYYYN